MIRNAYQKGTVMASKDEKKVHHISDGGPPPPAEDLSLEEIFIYELGGEQEYAVRDIIL